MNVYVLEVARQLAHRGVAVDLFTRTTSASQPAVVEVEPGVVVRHVTAGPYEGLSKEDLPGQLCAFAAGMMRVAAHAPPGYYDLVHSHYWLSGQVGWLAADRWGVPLVHTMHTMARVKNLHLADGDEPEPARPRDRRGPGRRGRRPARREHRARGGRARRALRRRPRPGRRRGAGRRPVDVHAGLGRRGPGRGRRAAGCRAPPLRRTDPAAQGPDVLVRAAAEILRRRPDLRSRLVVAVLGGASGTGVRNPMGLDDLAERRGIADLVRLVPPVDRPTLAQWYRAADVVAVPSHSESFGLVAVEAQACGTPVVAANVGGLPTAVSSAGVLVDGHDTADWATALAGSPSTPSDGPGWRVPRPSTPPASAGRAPPSGSPRSTPTRWPDPREASINDADLLTGIPTAVIP